MSLHSRVYRVGVKDTTFKLSECAELDKMGDTILSPHIGWLKIPSVSKIAVHLVVRNSAGLICKLGAKVSAVDPEDINLQDLGLGGVDYDGEIDSITADGEYVIDIVNTSCPIIDPIITITSGEAEFTVIVGGKN